MRIFLYFFLSTLIYISCKNEEIKVGYLDQLKTNDSLKLWARYDSCEEFESIWIFKKNNYFKACCYNCNSWTDTTEVFDSCKVISKNEQRLINSYIERLMNKPAKGSAETFSGLVLYTTDNVEIYTNIDKRWRGFDTIKQEIFNFK